MDGFPELLSDLWVHHGPAVIHGHRYPALCNSTKLGSLFIGQNSFCIRIGFFLDSCQLLDLVSGESELTLQCSNAHRAVRIKLGLAHMLIPPHHRMVLHVLHLCLGHPGTPRHVLWFHLLGITPDPSSQKSAGDEGNYFRFHGLFSLLLICDSGPRLRTLGSRNRLPSEGTVWTTSR